jgi:hypothetical protein
MAAPAPLVVVVEAFAGRGSGVLVAPRITVADPPRGTFPVRLRLPDGSERMTIASFDAAHIRGPGGAFAMVRLPELAVGDVPAGTEIWRA